MMDAALEQAKKRQLLMLFALFPWASRYCKAVPNNVGDPQQRFKGIGAVLVVDAVPDAQLQYVKIYDDRGIEIYSSGIVSQKVRKVMTLGSTHVPLTVRAILRLAVHSSDGGNIKYQGGVMSSVTALKIALACAISAISCVASAQISDIDFLICNVGDGGEPLLSAWERLKPLESPNGDGSFVIAGPVREQGLCIKNATVGASFGVFLVIAEICSSTELALVERLTKQSGFIPHVDTQAEPGTIGTFINKNNTLIIFHGRASTSPKLEPKSNQISYSCAIKMSGPQ